jgi:hypothetical protein
MKVRRDIEGMNDGCRDGLIRLRSVEEMNI